MNMVLQVENSDDAWWLKFLNVVDEHSCLCLAILAGRKCIPKVVMSVLDNLT